MRPTPGDRTDPLLNGATIDDLVVDELCGRGGFGEVFRAHDRDGRQVALKVLQLERAAARNALRRFELEAELLGRLDHPGIVRVHRVGHLPDGRPYLSMEWIEGPTLEGVLADETPKRERALAWIGAIASATHAAHSAGIVHRDIKPSNVLMRDGSEPVLVDFGLVKLAHTAPDLGLTTTGTSLGTPLTMAPEQILAEPIDHRADIYALGVVAFRILTGHYPFRAPTVLELQELHVNGVIPDARESCPDLGSGASAALAAAMAKRADDRPADVRAFARALGAPI